jgi:hypothetical protein
MATELPHPDDLEFAPIRADLARLYLAHKYELSMADWPDDEIVARTSDISAALVALTMHARQNGDQAWLDRHAWFLAACTRLLDDGDAVRLDG